MFNFSPNAHVGELICQSAIMELLQHVWSKTSANNLKFVMYTSFLKCYERTDVCDL